MLPFLLESGVRSLGLGVVVWIGLSVLRVRCPSSRSTAWTAVLLTAVLMPLLMPAMAAVMASAPPAALEWIPAGPSSVFLRPLSSAPAGNIASFSMDWLAMGSALYIAIAAGLIVRLLVGSLRSRRLCRTATPVIETWASGVAVRVSDAISIPFTYGSTILLPSDWSAWSDFKRNAILLHEKSHVRRGDFYVLLLAGLHRAIFWFSPLAWWLQNRLAEHAETACDDAAIQEVGDRVSYAEILVEMAARSSGLRFEGVAMARGRTVVQRVERVLRESRVCPPASVMRRTLMIAAFVPITAFAAGSWLVEAQTKASASLPAVVALLQQNPAPQPATVPPAQQPAPQTQRPAQATVPVGQDGALASWPEQEVPDIIANEEVAAFRTLRRDEEREQFINQFWLRRDPTPGTFQNEFRDEYYARVVDVNRRFSTPNSPGWRTDRGRVILLHGEPDEIVTHAPGGAPPFEKWRYRFIEGVGNNVVLEFVDTAGDGNYRLSDFQERSLIIKSTPPGARQ